MALKNVTGIDITYDNKVAGNLIDPYEWNNNFQKIETNINENIENLNKNFTLLAGDDGAAEIGIEDYVGSTEVASTVGAQILLIASKIVNMYSKTQIDSMINAGKSNTVSSISYDSDDGTFTITKADGTTSSIDTNIEKIPVSVELEEDEVSGKVYLKITTYDGSSSKADVTSLLNVYTVSDTTTIDMTILEGEISAAIKKGSITSDYLSSGVIETFEAYKTACSSYAVSAQGSADAAAESASASAKNASDADKDAKAAAASAGSASSSAVSAESAASAAGLSKDAAEDSAKASESWAVGGTGTRTGEDTNNAKYWAQQSKSAASGEYVPIAGGTMTGELILSGSPASAKGAATKEYVDKHGGVLIRTTSSSYTLSDMEKFASTESALYIADPDWNCYYAVIDRPYNYDDGNAVFMFRVLDSTYAAIRNYKYTIDESGSGEWSCESVSLTPKNSPVLTGVPQAPALTNSSPDTQIAVKGYVDPAILEYDTPYTEEELNKIIALNKRIFILVSSRQFPVLTVNIAVGKYIFYCYGQQNYGNVFEYNTQNNTWTLSNIELAEIDSPTFTGTPKAPTAAAGTNTTQIATTAFVKYAVDDAKVFWMVYGYPDFNWPTLVETIGSYRLTGVLDEDGTKSVGSCLYKTGTVYDTVTISTPKKTYKISFNKTTGEITWSSENAPTTIYDNNSNAIKVWTGTQTEYEAITTKNANTLYLVKE